MRRGWARVSSKEQASTHSLENQVARLKSAGCDRIYADVGSGYKKKALPDMERLIKDLEVGDEVVITNVDRLSRNEAIAFKLFDLFEEKSVKLIALDQPYLDLSHPDGRVMAGYQVVDARAYSAKLSVRVRQGHKDRRDRNLPYFAPFGYVVVWDSVRVGGLLKKANERYELDQTPFLCLLSDRPQEREQGVGSREQGKKIEEMVGKQYLHSLPPSAALHPAPYSLLPAPFFPGRTKAQIGRDCIEIFLRVCSVMHSLRVINTKYGINYHSISGKGNRQARGIFRFKPSGFGSWLNNPILRGHTCYGRSYRQRQSHKHLWDIRRDTHTAHKLMTDVEYAEIERILDLNAKNGGYNYKSPTIHPLSGVVYCGECNRKSVVVNYRLRSDRTIRKYAYQCHSYKLKACPQKTSIRNEKIEAAVIDALRDRAAALTNIAQIPPTYIEPPELSQLRSQLQGLSNLGQNPAIEAAKIEMRSQIAALVGKSQQHSFVDEGLKQLLLDIYSETRFWEGMENDRKREIYRRVVDKVVVRDGKVERVHLKI